MSGPRSGAAPRTDTTLPAVRPARRTLGVRGQLMLFLCAMSLFLLLLVMVLCANLLQPRYNLYLYEKLDAKLDYLLTMMDDTIADGGNIAQRDLSGAVIPDADFWQKVNDAVTSGVLNLNRCCVDVSDRTMRQVNASENLYPCLIHDSDSDAFNSSQDAAADSADGDTAMAVKLRVLCFERGELYQIIKTPSGSRQMVVGGVTADGSYCVLVSANIAQVEEAGAVLQMLLPGVAAVLFLVSLAAAWLFSRWFTRPLTALSRAAKTMASGQYGVRVPVNRADELGNLSADFNYMAGEVQRTSRLQQDLLANVSHDLRTPLTLIKGYAETLRDITGKDPEKRADQLNIIIDETDRLSGLVNSVMELSKVSSGAEKCEPVRFDMGQLCEEVAERYEGICAQNGWKLELDVPEDTELNVWADPSMMERALHNLLGNAMHHIGPDGIFCLRARAVAGGVRVEVADHGPGIAPEDLPRIFDRYYRSRSDAGKTGTGLGLSITKAIFLQHGARFGVDSAPGQGACFWFELKDKPPAPPPPPKGRGWRGQPKRGRGENGAGPAGPGAVPRGKTAGSAPDKAPEKTPGPGPAPQPDQAAGRPAGSPADGPAKKAGNLAGPDRADGTPPA